MNQENTSSTTEQPSIVAAVAEAGAEKNRDQDGKFASKPTEDQVLDRLLGTEPSGEKAVSEKQETAVAISDRAAKALRLDGWTDDDFAGIPPERLNALGETAAKRQSKIAKKLEAASKGEPSERGEARTSESGGAQAEPARQPSDLKQVLKPVYDTLGDEYGDALVKAISSSTESLRTELNGLKSQFGNLSEDRASELVDKSRKELEVRYPQLKDEEEFDGLMDEMRTLASIPGRYTPKDIGRLMEDAIVLKRWTPATPKVDKRSTGQPVASSRPMPVSALSREDKEDAVLNALFKGADRQSARQLYHGR